MSYYTLFLTLLEVFLLIWSLFTKSGRDSWGWFFNHIVGGAVGQVKPLLDELAPTVAQIAGQLRDALNSHGGGIVSTIGGDFQSVARTALETQRGALASLGESTPDNAIDAAAEAFAVAFGAGLTSAGVAALFEAVFPEKLNTLNGVAPMLAKMAGFDEVAAEVIGPLYSAAFGKSLEYKYRSQFKPEYAKEPDAVRWHARRLLSDADLAEVFGVSGLKAKYETPFIASAYNPVSPRASRHRVCRCQLPDRTGTGDDAIRR